ncbi:MAG: hypothetical protein A3J51_06100 [Omnitrophica WOR_2 bacterium RIFCSPHIGHO2_02_FULL_45_21]|nr:MAG: hypothetical protein A3J51_06100 [Omnitrophica WOR_2 bacterium RIFCSPHIGHO2_02_FULL_45_21]
MPFSLCAQGEVDKMLTNLHWLGHASFRLDASRIIYFDPWKLPKDSRKAGIIFISHDHFDHFSKDDIALISTKETVLVTDKSVGRQLEGKLVCKEIKSLKPGNKIEVSNGVKVQAVYSYNLNKEFHPKEDGKLGFIVTIDGISIYHAGDTDYIPEMKDYACDIALLPVSGTYVMTADEAANAALAIKPRAAIPMHYGDIVGSNSDAEVFRDSLKDKVEVRILKKEK